MSPCHNWKVPRHSFYSWQHGTAVAPWDDATPHLRSGYQFTMTTDDRELKPLPDPALLKLQWNLQRIWGMTGAAEWVDDDDADDDDPDSWAQRVAYAVWAGEADRRSSSPSNGSDDNGEAWYS